jgi:hypothetical protein
MSLILQKISWILTFMSILGGFFVASEKHKSRRAGFIIWIIANIGWIIFNIHFKIYSAAILFSVYTIQSVIGIMNTLGKYNFLKKITWVGYLNFIILQWLFIRLGYYHKKITEPYYTKYEKKYKIAWRVVPLTGWWSDFVYLEDIVHLIVDSISGFLNKIWKRIKK